MRICFLGNMNNIHFSMVRYMRDLGFDSELGIFDREQEHFSPSSDTYSVEFMDYCHKLKWGSFHAFLKTSRKDIESFIDRYDFIVGCGLAPAYLEKIGRKLDVFVPYGDDIWNQTFFSYKPNILTLYTSVLLQRRGIKQASVIHNPQQQSYYESQLKKYKGKQSVRWLEGIPMVYAKEYQRDLSNQTIFGSHWAPQFHEIRNSCDLMVVSYGRHSWVCKETDIRQKDNDIILKGWAKYVKKNRSHKSKLVTLEYGSDVEKSRELIHQLGIEDSVIWLPKMTRKDLMVGLKLADASCGLFRHKHRSNGTFYESMVAGTPILANGDEKMFPDTDARCPIVQASCPESIAVCLNDIKQSKQRFIEKGNYGKIWYEENVVEKALSRYVDFFMANK